MQTLHGAQRRTGRRLPGARRLLTVLAAGVVLAADPGASLAAAAPTTVSVPAATVPAADRSGAVEISDPEDFPNMAWADALSAAMRVRTDGAVRFDLVAGYLMGFDYPDWTEEFTRVEWFVDVDGDSAWEYDVMMFVTLDGRPVFRVYRPNDSVACRGTASGSTALSRITVVVPPSCLGSPDRIRMTARFHYEDTDFGVTRNDRVPNSGWSAPLVLDGGGGGGGGGTQVPGRVTDLVGTTATDGTTLRWSLPKDVGSSPLTSVVVQAREVPAPVRRLPGERIVGGSAIDISEAPWQVMLNIDNAYLCGGTLIDPQWVLTAAHCVEDDPDTGSVYPASAFEVWAGVTTVTEAARTPALVVDRVVIHPGWDTDTSENDVALLRLAEPTSAGTPIRLYSRRAGPAAGTEAFISGWGRLSSGGASPERLQGTTIQVLAGPSDECGDYNAGEFVQSVMLCGGVPGGGKDTCQGDSGGPLVVPVGETWQLAGVTSWGTGCATARFPGVYARVSTFVPWIYATMGWSTVKRVDCTTSACGSTTVRTLDPGSFHVFRAAATNGAGRGPWSGTSLPVRAG